MEIKNMNKEKLKLFYWWIFERQEIWYKRFVLNLPAPWTEDPILAKYKFTNVYRELDRETQWLIKNVIEPYEKIDLIDRDIIKNIFWKIIVFRYFVKSDLFEFMGGLPSLEDYNPEKFESAVLNYRQQIGFPFTTSYTIAPPTKPEDLPLGYEKFYCKLVNKLYNKIDTIIDDYFKSNNPKEFINSLISNIEKVGTFTAYEIYADLTYTRWFRWSEDDYVNVGPGAKKGLNIIFPELKKTVEYESKIYYLRNMSSAYFNMFGFDIKYYNKDNPQDYQNGKPMTLKTIEHSLCEFYKYNNPKGRQHYKLKNY